MEKEAVEDELDMYGGPSDNQLSNAALELVALAGMELPRANGNQTFFTPATCHLYGGYPSKRTLV